MLTHTGAARGTIMITPPKAETITQVTITVTKEFSEAKPS
jgi:hypothetical protein